MPHLKPQRKRYVIYKLTSVGPTIKNVSVMEAWKVGSFITYNSFYFNVSHPRGGRLYSQSTLKSIIDYITKVILTS